jgi:hypothetical protein
MNPKRYGGRHHEVVTRTQKKPPAFMSLQSIKTSMKVSYNGAVSKRGYDSLTVLQCRLPETLVGSLTRRTPVTSLWLPPYPWSLRVHIAVDL